MRDIEHRPAEALGALNGGQGLALGADQRQPVERVLLVGTQINDRTLLARQEVVHLQQAR
jgi:hypothetical protein